MKRIIGILTLALCTVTSIDVTQAEDETEEKVDAVFVIQPIVTSPGKKKQELNKAPRNVESLSSAKASERQAADIPELLQESAGVFVQRTNRGAGSPIIRGLIGPQNLIVVDGVRFNTATFRTGPNQYLALLDPHGIRSAEVLLGPSSVLYGSGAMGGVVYISYDRPLLADEGEV